MSPTPTTTGPQTYSGIHSHPTAYSMVHATSNMHAIPWWPSLGTHHTGPSHQTTFAPIVFDPDVDAGDDDVDDHEVDVDNDDADNDDFVLMPRIFLMI